MRHPISRPQGADRPALRLRSRAEGRAHLPGLRRGVDSPVRRPYSDRINSMTKYVVSSTLRDPEWNNTTVISGDPIAAIRRLKEQPGQDIVQYGFGQLSYALLEHGLLDELRLWVHPLFVSQATPCRPAVPAVRHRPGRAHRHARADPAGCR